MGSEVEKTLENLSLRDIVEQLPGHVYWKATDGRLIGCNKKNRDDFGLTPDDLGKKKKNQFLSSEQMARVERIDQQVLESGDIIIDEEVGTTKDGRTALYLSHKAPLKDQYGNIVGLAGVSLDITKERQQEIDRLNTLESVIALMPGHVYWKDQDGRYLGCNDAQAKSLGLASNKDIVSTVPYASLPEEEASMLRSVDNQVLREGKTITLEEAGVRENGAVGVFLTKKTPLYTKEGHIMGLLGISFDITERKEAEKMLRLAKEKAEESNKIKSEFISNMEHDIRTPFSGIWGFANILYEKEQDPEKKECLSGLATCAKELLDYCNGIVDFSRIEQGVMPILEKAFDIKKLVNSVIKMNSIAAMNQSLELLTDFQTGLPSIVIGDPYRLKRILLNLVSNSIKFTKQGHVKVTVSLENAILKQRYCVIRITVDDTGIGIPDDKQDIVYEKFVRGTPSNKGLYKGQGLGLRIVKQFVAELDDDVHLKSQLGQGTTFTILLPFKLPLAKELVDDDLS